MKKVRSLMKDVVKVACVCFLLPGVNIDIEDIHHYLEAEQDGNWLVSYFKKTFQASSSF